MNNNIETITTKLKQVQSEKDWLESQVKAWINTAQNLQEQCQKQVHQSSLVSPEQEEKVEFFKSELELTQKQLKLTELQLHQTQEELELSHAKLHLIQKQLKLTELQLHQTQEELEQLQMEDQNGKNFAEETVSAKKSKTQTKIANQALNKPSELSLETYQDYMKIGNQLRKNRKMEEAVHYYLKATQIDSKNHLAYVGIKNALESNSFSENILSKMNHAFEQLIKNEPKNIFAHFLLARCLTAQGKIDESIQFYQKGVYQKILKLQPKYVQKNWDLAQWRGPSYIVIGAPKCATTSLDKYLAQHPQILPAIVKELGYFSSKLSQQKIDYYFSHFPPTPEDHSFISGDADPNYLYIQNVPERIFAALPNIKLISMLRNPVDRTISNYHHAVRLGRETRSLETVIHSELEIFEDLEEFNWQIFHEKLQHKCKFLGRSIYIAFLEKWLSIFPKEQLLILKTEDLKENPAKLMNTVFSFLELSKHSFVFDKKHNTGSYDPLSQELRNKLSEFFKPYNQKLEEYLGRKFDWE